MDQLLHRQHSCDAHREVCRKKWMHWLRDPGRLEGSHQGSSPRRPVAPRPSPLPSPLPQCSSPLRSRRIRIPSGRCAPRSTRGCGSSRGEPAIDESVRRHRGADVVRRHHRPPEILRLGKAGHDFRSLINRAKIPERRNLPAEFIEFWRSLCERNQRKCKPAHRALVAAWRSGAAIPGYEGTDQPRHEIPAGWDYSNLMRYRPAKFELATMRQGHRLRQGPRPASLQHPGRSVARESHHVRRRAPRQFRDVPWQARPRDRDRRAGCLQRHAG